MEFQTPTNHDTAICLIPPDELCHSVNRLRFDNDKAYSKWPPHVNLIYPFIRSTSKDDLLQNCSAIVSCLKARTGSSEPAPLSICLDSPGLFSHRKGSTLFLCDKNEDNVSRLALLRDTILAAIGETRSGPYNMHMTIAQCEDTSPSSKLEFLLEKLRRLPPVAWHASQLVVLTRSASGKMKKWGFIDLVSPSLTLCQDTPSHNQDAISAVIPQRTWHFSQSDLVWQPLAQADQTLAYDVKQSKNLIVSSWNVLAEFNHPPSHIRYPLIVDNLIAGTALADIVVLQEVTDDFLLFLLEDERIRGVYSYVSEGPPDHPVAGPLPNILNTVVLSKYVFSWRYLPSKRQHKGSCVLEFEGLGHCKTQESGLLPLILATCHLSQGLTDGAVVAKEKELQRILGYLKENHAENQWIVAGDFNIATSSYTIDTAIRRGAITAKTENILHSIEATLAEANLLDAWMVSRVEAGVSDNIRGSVNGIFEGEQGATFDPTENPHAAKMVGSGLNNRPQRYDRILVKSGGPLQISRFNMFGFLTDEGERTGEPLYASDHWGIRCLLEHHSQKDDLATHARVIPVEIQRAPASLSDTAALRHCLDNLDVIPTSQDESLRKLALEFLQQILLEDDQPSMERTRGQPTIVLVPVGSYALGVWSKSSDIDCLCIGSISSKVFFTLARQRLKKSARPDIRILRKVKAKTGTMLEMEVLGLRCDLQYCQAVNVASQWPDLLKRPSSDPAFSLPTQTLLKLKPARDLFYLLRSVPDLAQFRICYQVIKAWAKARGIYAAKFGYFGGIHLSVMLVRVCKMLLHGGGVVSTPDIIVTFFNHYSRFDWRNDIVFDPYFHKQLRYHRTQREAMCLLGWHSPTLNTALIASIPTVDIISTEFHQANAQLTQEGTTWKDLLSAPANTSKTNLTAGAANFLTSYRSFVSLRIHYWGGSLERGSRLVGWLESRCASLLVDISRKVPELAPRIWPARFVEAATHSSQTDQNDYQGAYLVGLEWTSPDKKPGQDLLEVAHSNLHTVLQQFEQHIHSDEKYYDPNTAWFSATVVRASELNDLMLDDREWGQYVDGDDDSDTEEEDEEDKDGDPEDERNLGLPTAKARKKGRSAKQSHSGVPVPKPEGAEKLRTALDVLNRLRWDPNIDGHDFLIGYEDRFLGPQEKALAEWKSEQTHEEFIPQHRILWFKRRSDNTIVWHRSERIDLLFRKP
ncbi:endonuclease exonuclease phosphatase [Colletotrichum truncatum]|uniref:Endonuclease exonuclease phosphatase n=1 Tax=Colletotrichum truncatum TaxID=5467 RepID=A0ACC3ZJ96_COLTU|nr:endonuclease exonuclease phosphatase [Colletotrichum truncatum]KAF6782414.1 endonuclease exonuclease phosphatase [Colletotrichum truncatum]